MENKDSKELYIKVTKDGPYVLYGVCEIAREKIISDEDGIGIEYQKDKVFDTENNPVCLCRCGKSRNAPFCDGIHLKAHFDGTETALFETLLSEAKIYEGPNLILADNEKFCAFARFCDANGTIWNLIFNDDEQSAKEVIKASKLCPAGRFLVFDKQGKLFDDNLPQGISVLEDEGLKISGPLWLKGNIRVESTDGRGYEVRNRQALCRCGKSKNKPFCDSTHRHIDFRANYL